MMRDPFSVASIMPILWGMFMATWLASAFFVKKDVHREWPPAGLVATRLLFFFIVALLFRLGRRPGSSLFDAPRSPNDVLAWMGLVVCALGIGFAIWARIHLGRNWSGHPSLKAGHELVTAGPYRFVRHPIYTGILIAILGTALALGARWLLLLLVAGTIFGRRVGVEERLMMKQFPEQYPAYRRRTKALIPFII